MLLPLLQSLLLAATLVIAGWIATQNGAAQSGVKSVHGDWQVRCETPPGAQDQQCALVQSVTAEDRPDVGLTIILVKATDQKSTRLRVLAPMGVLLPAGLGLKIDEVDVGRIGFVR